MKHFNIIKLSLAALAVFSAIGLYHPSTAAAQLNPVLVEEIRDSADALLEVSDTIESLPEEFKEAPKVKEILNKALGKAEQVAEKRKELVKAIIQKNPDEITKVAVSGETRGRMVDELEDKFEKRVSKKGKLKVLHIDDFDKLENSKNQLFITVSSGAEEEIFSTKIPASLVSSMDINISGYSLDANIAVAGADGGFIITGPPIAQLSSSGEERVAVIPLKFQDDPSEPITVEEIRAMFFNSEFSIKNFYLENSYNATRLNIDVYNWATLPRSTVFYDQFTEILQYDDSYTASASYISFSNYDRIIFLYNNRLPSFSGGVGSVGKYTFLTPDGLVTLSVSWIFQTQQPFMFNIIRHELGHNFGVWHAGTWKCGENDVPSDLIDENSIFNECVVNPIEDSYDIMGYVAPSDMSAAHRKMIGWPVKTQVVLSKNGAPYKIYPSEIESPDTQELRIPIRNSNNEDLGSYSVEYRKPIGFDNLQDIYDGMFGQLKDGVLVRFISNTTGISGADTFNIGGDKSSTADFVKIFNPGTPFIDPYRDIRITVLGKDSESATVAVTPLIPPPYSGSSVALDTLSPPQGTTYIEGQTGIKLARFALIAGRGDVKVTNLQIIRGGDLTGNPLVNNIVLKQGMTLLTSPQPGTTDGIIDINLSSPLIIPAHNSRIIDLIADIASLDEEYNIYFELTEVTTLDSYYGVDVEIIPSGLPLKSNTITLTNLIVDTFADVSILSPGLGESWWIGGNFIVRWNIPPAAKETDLMSIGLKKLGEPSEAYIIVDNIPITQGFYSWTIPNDIYNLAPNPLPSKDYLLFISPSGLPAKIITSQPFSIREKFIPPPSEPPSSMLPRSIFGNLLNVFTSLISFGF